MPTFEGPPELDWKRLARCREQVRREMIAVKFQPGMKFDTVLERRARQRYRGTR